MAGTQFSSDVGKAGPGRPARGAQDRRIDREQRQAAPKGSAKDRGSAGASRGDGPHLGFPQAPLQPEKPPDFRHVQLLSQHVNMQGLGRDIPFGVRASLTGEFHQILQPGQVPFDILEDM